MPFGDGTGVKRSALVFITLITGIAYLTVFAHRFIPAVVAADMGRDLGAGPAMLGMLSSGYFYMYGLSQMPFGVLVDSIGPRKILTFSFIIAGVGAVVFAIAPSPAWSIVSRFTLGLGCGSALVASMTLLARWVPKSKFPAYLTALYLIGGLGPLLAASPLAYLSSSIGWRGACLAIGIFTLAYSAVLFATIRDYPPGFSQTANPRRTGSMFAGVTTVAKTFQFWLVVVFGIGVPSIYLVYCGLWAGPFLTDVYGYSKTTVGSVLSFGAVGSLLGFLLGPLFSDKIVKSRKKVLVIFSVCLFATIMPLVLQIELPFPFLCLQALCVGIFSCGGQPVAIMVVKEMFPINITGTALGMFNTFPLLCGGLLQLLIGVIISFEMKNVSGKASSDIYAVAFSVMAVVCFFGFLSALMIKEKSKNLI